MYFKKHMNIVVKQLVVELLVNLTSNKVCHFFLPENPYKKDSQTENAFLT